MEKVCDQGIAIDEGETYDLKYRGGLSNCSPAGSTSTQASSFGGNGEFNICALQKCTEDSTLKNQQDGEKLLEDKEVNSLLSECLEESLSESSRGGEDFELATLEQQDTKYLITQGCKNERDFSTDQTLENFIDQLLTKNLILPNRSQAPILQMAQADDEHKFFEARGPRPIIHVLQTLDTYDRLDTHMFVSMIQQFLPTITQRVHKKVGRLNKTFAGFSPADYATHPLITIGMEIAVNLRRFEGLSTLGTRLLNFLQGRDRLVKFGTLVAEILRSLSEIESKDRILFLLSIGSCLKQEWRSLAVWCGSGTQLDLGECEVPLESITHYGYKCAICGEENICGPRFHCDTCQDYDLCGRCSLFRYIAHEPHLFRCFLRDVRRASQSPQHTASSTPIISPKPAYPSRPRASSPSPTTSHCFAQAQALAQAYARSHQLDAIKSHAHTSTFSPTTCSSVPSPASMYSRPPCRSPAAYSPSTRSDLAPSTSAGCAHQFQRRPYHHNERADCYASPSTESFHPDEHARWQSQISTASSPRQFSHFFSSPQAMPWESPSSTLSAHTPLSTRDLDKRLFGDQMAGRYPQDALQRTPLRPENKEFWPRENSRQAKHGEADSLVAEALYGSRLQQQHQF